MSAEIQGSSSHTTDLDDPLNRTQEVYHDLLIQETAPSNVRASRRIGQAHVEPIKPSPWWSGRPLAECREPRPQHNAHLCRTSYSPAQTDRSNKRDTSYLVLPAFDHFSKKMRMRQYTRFHLPSPLNYIDAIRQAQSNFSKIWKRASWTITFYGNNTLSEDWVGFTRFEFHSAETPTEWSLVGKWKSDQIPTDDEARFYMARVVEHHV